MPVVHAGAGKVQEEARLPGTPGPIVPSHPPTSEGTVLE